MHLALLDTSFLFLLTNLLEDFESPLLHKLTWPKISWAPGLFDLDNDSDLDLFFSSGHLNSVSGDNRQSNLMFEDNGKGQFKDITESSGVLSSGKRIHRSAIFADYDNDGKVDLYITVNGQQVEDGKGNTTLDENQGKGVLFHNESKTENNWLKIRLEGIQSNRDGFGAIVTIKANDIEQRQALTSGQGYFSNNAQELYFGLGRSESVDTIEIRWPSGIKESFKSIPANQTIYIIEDKALHQNTLVLKK